MEVKKVWERSNFKKLLVLCGFLEAVEILGKKLKEIPRNLLAVWT